MKRRLFLTAAGVGAAASTVAAPAIAQSSPEIKWRLASSFPKSLDTLFGVTEYLAKRVAEATDNKFQIRPFAGGEIVPPFGVMEAVQNNTIEMAHTASYYFFGKDPTFALDCAVPFSLNARQMNAWMYFGGGLTVLRDFYKGYNIYNIPCGSTGAQMGGWYRKEVKTVADLKGLKFRIGGFAGQVLVKLGVVPQMIAGGDIYPSLEKGTIDAAEWVGPYDDEKLGFNKVAKFYYYPGWWEGGAQLTTYINLELFNKLPKAYQTILETACADAHNWTIGKYDAQNPAALKRLVASGTQLRPYSREILEACFKAAEELYAETSEKFPSFKKVYASMKEFRSDQALWFRIAESAYDGFMGHLSAQKKI